ncbi:hypothetical protein LTR95_017881 [Oleoguttula sp. CCFEE 5521]
MGNPANSAAPMDSNPVSRISYNDYNYLRSDLTKVLTRFIVTHNHNDKSKMAPFSAKPNPMDGLSIIAEHAAEIIQKAYETRQSNEWMSDTYVMYQIITKAGLDLLAYRYTGMEEDEQTTIRAVMCRLLGESPSGDRPTTTTAPSSECGQSHDATVQSAELQLTKAPATQNLGDLIVRKQMTEHVTTGSKDNGDQKLPVENKTLVYNTSSWLTRVLDTLLCITLALFSAHLLLDLLSE